jgi:RNA polymerase sigma-70 factor, ECF subfamily
VVPARRIEAIFREERARVLATTIRAVGRDFGLAEEAVQDAFALALEQWQRDGVPDQPRAWLVGVARHKAIDALRRRTRLGEIAQHLEPPDEPEPVDPIDDASVPDDRLRLVMTCCHPALAEEAQVALTLRTVAGLSTEELARAFLVPVATMAQRLVRAKTKIRDAGIPYRVPDRSELPARLESVMFVVYLVFTEGYAATAGDAMIRRELCAEAIRLGRLLVELTGSPEAEGLLALMLLHDARRETRVDADGDVVLLEDQDRARWDRAQIAEGLARVEPALRGGAGAYAVQAAIAALHARAERAADTDWPQIVALYRVLLGVRPTPVVALNHAAAVAMTAGPQAALTLVEALAPELGRYHLFHAARADLLRRLGRRQEAHRAYEAALALVTAVPERRFLERRLAETG